MRQFIFAFTITIIVGLAIVTILPAAETPVANQTTNELDIVPASGSPVMESVPFQKNAGCDAGASYPAYSCLSVLLLHPLHHKISQPLNIINIQ